MKTSKKILFAILSIITILTLCIVIVLFTFPELYTGQSIEDSPVLSAKANSDTFSAADDELSIDAPVTLVGVPIESSEEPTASSETEEFTETELLAQAKDSSAESESSENSETIDTLENTLALSASDAALATDPKSSSESVSDPSESTMDASSESASEEPSDEANPVSNEKNADITNDKNAPVFLAFDSAPQVEVGKEFDIHKFVGYADDVDRDVKMDLSGSVDTSKEGTYPVKITLTDDAGHTTSKSMDVKVVTKKSKSESTRKTEAFSDFIASYKTEETLVGIDISRWQEAVDFEKVKNAGCEFVYMRIGGLDDGELYTDRYYQANIAGAKAAGLKIGIYWHAEECSPEEVRKSVDYLCNVLGSEGVDYPIAYDWEDFMNFERYGMNLQDINDCFTTFVDEMQKRGFSSCLYGSKNYLENVWTGAAGHNVWLAHYTGSTSYAGNYFIWQHSCTGQIDGVNGNVDLDVLYPSKLN